MKWAAICVLMAVVVILGFCLVVKQQQVDSIQATITGLQCRLDELIAKQQGKEADLKERRFAYLAKRLEEEMAENCNEYGSVLVTVNYKDRAVRVQYLAGTAGTMERSWGPGWHKEPMPGFHPICWCELDLVFDYDGNEWKPDWENCYYRSNKDSDTSHKGRRENLPNTARTRLPGSHIDKVRTMLAACRQTEQN
ncbi:MAG: hypothetical protein WCJ35_03310 [Planctomycetota bacterium]